MPASVRDFTRVEATERRLAQCQEQLASDRTEMLDALGKLHGLKEYGPVQGISLDQDSGLQAEQHALAAIVEHYRGTLATAKKAQSDFDSAVREAKLKAHNAVLFRKQRWAQQESPGLFERLAGLEKRLVETNSIETHQLYQDIWGIRQEVLEQIESLMAQAPEEE